MEDHAMHLPEERTIHLPADQAAYLDALVASGTYASPAEVVGAGLRALRERDAAVERWLREEVVPLAVAAEADPSQLLSAEEVDAAILAHHAQRTAERA